MWQEAAARDRTADGEQLEYAKNVVVKYLDTKDASLLPALRQALRLTAAEAARVDRSQSSRRLLGFL